MPRSLLARLVPFLVLGAPFTACSSSPEVVRGNDSEDGGAPSEPDPNEPEQPGLNLGGEDNSGGAPSQPPDDLCAAQPCPVGQTCEVVDDTPVCTPNDCDTLECQDDEECVEIDDGAVCESLVCEGDLDCAPQRHCDPETNQCTDDICTPGERSCDGDDVRECLANGGGYEVVSECGTTPSGFDASCIEIGGTAGCECTDDWDCSEYLSCENGICVGSGEEPTCRLPPADFSEVLPSPEIEWNAAATDGDGNARPYSESTHVLVTPIVANLTDDNDDGRIDERDVPEIVFMTYSDGNGLNNRGIIRAIHGGGPDKGKDYFALCGDPEVATGSGAIEHWSEGDDVALLDCDPTSDDAILRPAGAPAVGDMDGDGVPEIVVATRFGSVLVLDNTGAVKLETTRAAWPATNNRWKYPAVALADLDHDGLAEIVVGNHVVVLAKDNDGNLVEDRVLAGTARTGAQYFGNDVEHMGPMVCVANIAGDAAMEVVAGTSAYRLPPRLEDCDGANATEPWCAGTLELVWDGATENGTDNVVDGYTPDGETRGIAEEAQYHEGFCAIADVLGGDRTAAPGPDNGLDGVPEVVVIANGTILVFDGGAGKLLFRQALGGGEVGGAPNIDDFDGDGFPEVATALGNFYTVFDLQDTTASCPAWTDLLGDGDPPPGTNTAREPGGTCSSNDECNDGAFCDIPLGESEGTCACLHNSWRRDTEDDSSRATSSSVFDFNGDGAAEVVYNDECYLRVYDGRTSDLLFKRPSLSRTVIENAIVADVDNDGNAEIIQSNNTETRQCNEGTLSWEEGGETQTMARDSFLPGLRVWGDASDRWVSARRIWNQHSYHITNVTEGGRIPPNEANSWINYGSNFYNTYRSQPRSFGVAPDLTVVGVQLSSPSGGCNTGASGTLTISVELANEGDLRVGSGVSVVFEGTFGDDEPVLLLDEEGEVLTHVIESNLEPKGSLFFEEIYTDGNNGNSGLPSSVRVIVDPATDDVATGAALECNEANNSLEVDVSTDVDERAELIVSVGTPSGCPSPEVTITVTNTGTVDAEDVSVQLYVGNPQAGGTLLAEDVISEVSAGDSEAITMTAVGFPLGVPARLYAVVDPDNEIRECSDANNRGGPSQELLCPREIF